MSHVATEALKALVDAKIRFDRAEDTDLRSENFQDGGMHSVEWMVASDGLEDAMKQAKRVLDVLGAK